MGESITLKRQTVRTLIYSLCAAIVTFVFLIHPGNNGFEQAMFSDMVDGTAYRPYVSRALVPSGIKFVTVAMPGFCKEIINEGLQDTRLVKKLGWEPERLVDYTVASFIFFGCFLGLAFALRSLIAAFYPRYVLLSEFGPSLGLITLPIFFRYYNQIYDPATLLLFAIGILLLTRKSLHWYYLCFVLASINKETSVLLILLFYVAFRGKMPFSRFVSQITFQVILYIIIRGAISYAFEDNEGSFAQFHLGYNFYVLSQSTRLFYVITVYGMFALLILRRWNEKPAFLRSGLIVTLTPLIALVFLFGNLDEPRVYYEAFPFVFLLSIPSVMDVFDVDLYGNQ